MRWPILLRVQQTLTPAELDSTWEQVLAAGFDGVEFAFDGGAGRVVSHRLQVARTAARVKTSGLPGAVGGAENEPKNVVVAARCVSTGVEAGTAEVNALLHRAAALHARCLCLTLPPVARNAGREGFAGYQEAVNFVYQLLLQLRHEAESTGVAIAVEAATNGSLLSPVELREIINEANSWAVGVCLDVARVVQVGLAEDWIRTLSHRIHAVRLPIAFSARPPALPPDDRATELDAIAAVMEEIRYDRPVIATGAGTPEDIRRRLSSLGFPEMGQGETDT